MNKSPRLLLCTVMGVSLAWPHAGAQPACWNPFGCGPKTRAECVKEVGASARTEVAARAALAECRKLPVSTIADCKRAEAAWARHLKESDGAEWASPHKEMKDDCRQSYPATFNPRLWVTADYCKRNQAKLAATADAFAPGSKFSKGLDRFNADSSYIFIGSDPWFVIEQMQKNVYPDKPISELASRLYMDSPPDQPQVTSLCDELLRPGSAK